MKMFLRIVGILLILLGWGIAILLNSAYTGDSVNELHQLSWDVAEEQIVGNMLDGRLLLTADAAVTTPFWRHISWAQKIMDRAESAKSDGISLDEELQEGVYCTGVFSRDGSQKIMWFGKKDQNLESEMEKLINSKCPLEPDSAIDPPSNLRIHPKTKMLFSFKPDTASSYKALNLLVLNDDITDSEFSAVIFAFDYDYVIAQVKDCLNNYWPSLFYRIFPSKGTDYGIRIREDETPIFTWGYPDSIVTVEHQIEVRGEVHTRLDEEKVAKGKNAVVMFGRPARLYIDWGVVARSLGQISKLMSKTSPDKMLSRLAVKANLGTSILMTLGLILILVSMRKRKKE